MRQLTAKTLQCKECKRIITHKTRNLVCSTCRSRKKRNENKLLAIKFKGSRCAMCGYDKSIYALTFHHINPKEKELELADSWHFKYERLQEELNKCILVCHNCHSEIHEKEGLPWDLKL